MAIKFFGSGGHLNFDLESLGHQEGGTSVMDFLMVHVYRRHFGSLALRLRPHVTWT